MASIDTRNEQRDGHLRSDDFFDVETYPKLTFVSTSVEQTDEETLRVTGDLTIKGTTKPVTIDFTFTGAATDPFGNERVGFEGSVVVNRKDWDLTWNAALETGGVLVSDKVTLEFDLERHQEPPEPAPPRTSRPRPATLTGGPAAGPKVARSRPNAPHGPGTNAPTWTETVARWSTCGPP